MPSPFRPWHDEQLTANRARPLAIVAASSVELSALAGANAAYSPPLASRPTISTAGAANRLRRRAESRAEILRVSSRTTGPIGSGLLDEVDGREQADPHHVDEVPVVGHDDGGDGLLVGEATCDERATEHEEEGDQTAGDVQTVEARGQVEHRPVRRRGDGQTFVDQLGVLERLTADEDSAHDVGEHEPLAQAPEPDVQHAAAATDLATLRGED